MLISGGGTTATKIIEACALGGPLKGLVTPALIISSNAKAAGLERTLATRLISRTDQVVLNPTMFASPLQFGQAILDECDLRHIDFIGQYGWMIRTPENVIAQYNRRMVNQHPGPIDIGHPDFGGPYMHGKRVHCARLIFVREVQRNFWTEATAQRVHRNFDEGECLRVEQVPILPGDDVETLSKRVLDAEYRNQIETLIDFAHGREHKIIRESRLVLPGEEHILSNAKRIARMLYP